MKKPTPPTPARVPPHPKPLNGAAPKPAVRPDPALSDEAERRAYADTEPMAFLDTRAEGDD